MEKDFYITFNEWNEENIFEERTVENIITEFSKLYNGNPFKIIGLLVNFMKNNYEAGNDEIAELYYESVISIIKDNLSTEPI